VFYFYNAGAESVYLSSADWMDRNFFRRVEIAFPVLEKTLKKRVIDEAFMLALRDNRLAWVQQPDGSYTPVSNRRAAFKLHEHLMNLKQNT
jgi:polyphosphate kinase